MRFRAGVVVVLIALLSGAVPVDAARPRRAMRSYHYTHLNHHVGAPGTGAGVWDQREAYTFELQKGERSIDVMVLDDNERPVSAAIVQIEWDYHQGGASVGHSVTHEEFCGRTEAPVELVPDLEIQIFLQKGVCDDGTPSLPTTGDIVVDFYKS